MSCLSGWPSVSPGLFVSVCYSKDIIMFSLLSLLSLYKWQMLRMYVMMWIWFWILWYLFVFKPFCIQAFCKSLEAAVHDLLHPFLSFSNDILRIIVFFISIILGPWTMKLSFLCLTESFHGFFWVYFSKLLNPVMLSS